MGTATGPLTGAKNLHISVEASVFAIPIFLVSARIVAPSVSVRWTLTGAKNLHITVEASVFALPIFPASHPASIVGVHELNFCVRYGNRWTLMTINTNYVDGV